MPRCRRGGESRHGVRRLAVGLVLMLWFGATPTLAVPILDQDTTGQPAGNLSDDNDSTLYQVFTAGSAGVLDSIEIDIVDAPSPGLTFLLSRLNPAFSPASRNLLGTQLASISLPGVGVGPLSVDLSALGIAVQVGDAFVFRVEHDDFFSAKGAVGYAGGEAWFECKRFQTCVHPLGLPGGVSSGPVPTFFAVDEAGVGPRSLAFRTFMIPEPAWLVALGLAAVAAAARRR